MPDTKERILTEAEKLFFKHGARSVTMDDLAGHLGMSKKTVYQYFKDKDDIVCATISGFLKRQEKVMCELNEKADNALEEILLISEYLRKVFQIINPTGFFDVQKYHPKAWRIYEKHREECVLDSIVSNLKAGIEQNYYRSDINVEVLAKMRLEQIQLAFNQEIFPASKYPLTEVQLQFLDHFIQGITTLKGHRLFNKYKKISEEE